MKTTLLKTIPALICFWVLLIFQYPGLAQDDASDPERRRPIPEFDHTIHEEALEDEGCGVCHHIFDDSTNKLVYSEGEEGPCTECHLETRQDDIPAIREANHGSCNTCHRELKKRRQKAGPTTCGECHQK